MKKEGQSALNIVRGWDSRACIENIMGCGKLGGHVVWPFTGSLTLSLSEKTCQRKFPRSIALYCIVKESFALCCTVFYYISTEIYSLKSHVVNFRSEVSSGQSEERTTFFTCEKNRSSNQKLRTIFFHCIG